MPTDPLHGYGARLIEFVVLTAFFAACIVGIGYAPEVDAAVRAWKGFL